MWFQPVPHDWCNKGVYYPVYGMVHIKEPLLPIGRSSPCGGSGFPLSLSEWSFTICLMPYNRKRNVLSVSFFSVPDKETGEGQSVPLPVTGVLYDSLL